MPLLSIKGPDVTIQAEIKNRKSDIIMIHGKYIGQGEDLTVVKELREQVFTDGNLPYDLHEELDPMALNAVVDEEGIPVGTARLMLDLEAERFYVDNLCILEPYRGKQYGEFALRMLADKSDQCKAVEIWAEVPDFAKGFFEKFFFEPVGKSDGLTLMKAPLSAFQKCCSHCSE